MNAADLAEEASRERVKGFERTKRVLSYHIYRLHRKAKRYAENVKDEEKYYRALKALGYLSQVLTAAQRNAFDEEMGIAEKVVQDYDKVRADYLRLKNLEAKYVEVTSARPRQGESAC